MREYNVSIANENLEIFRKKEYISGKTKVFLGKSIEKMIEGTKIYSNYYKDSNKVPIFHPHPESDVRIVVNGQDSLSAAREQIMNYKSTCILNFASAKYPGGGFLKGSIAQEEDLCRKSTLYMALSMQEELYQWSRMHLRNGLYSEWCVFSPNVAVIRDVHLNLTHPVSCSVLTCPAPNRTVCSKNNISEEKIQRDMKSRCELILKVAAVHKQTNLVLGAFGCGVFGNDPYVVADIWKELLSKNQYGKYFKNITFAIKTGKNEENLKAFQKVFS